MAAADFLPSEDQFLCPICLDVFTDPVTTSCGHNFCKTCINKNWNFDNRYRCPMCKRGSNRRPELHVNTFISEIVSQFRQSTRRKTRRSSSRQQACKAGEVPCDVCTETKLKAFKSRLVCLTSYCQTHLEPHLTVTGLKRHQLIEPVENLESRICTKHEKPLELFCKTDQVCVCTLCTISDHKTHDVVPLKEEYEGKKVELVKTEAELQQMIKERQMKIEEMKCSVELSNESAQREKEKGSQVFPILSESIRRSLCELNETTEKNQTTTQKQAEGFIKELEQEICELKKRKTEVEELSQSEDHVHLLQSVQSLNTHQPNIKDWTGVIVRQVHGGNVIRALVQLEETLSQEMKKLVEAELKRVQKYAVDVTLDPDTAHPYLILSDDGRQVYLGDTVQNLPDNPKRFSLNPCVLGRQSFSTGSFYFEVQVKGKTEWDFGVARESISRKEDIPLSPEEGYWTIWRRRNKYRALDQNPVVLHLRSRPQKVGVFVDYEEGLVSFYDVNAAALIYSFTGCSFTEGLLPYFNPGLSNGGKNTAPLVLTPVGTPDLLESQI